MYFVFVQANYMGPIDQSTPSHSLSPVLWHQVHIYINLTSLTIGLKLEMIIS